MLDLLHHSVPSVTLVHWQITGSHFMGFFCHPKANITTVYYLGDQSAFHQHIRMFETEDIYFLWS